MITIISSDTYKCGGDGADASLGSECLKFKFYVELWRCYCVSMMSTIFL